MLFYLCILYFVCKFLRQICRYLCR